MWPLKWIFIAALMWFAVASNPVVGMEGFGSILATGLVLAAFVLVGRECWLSYRHSRSSAGRWYRLASAALLVVGAGTAVVRGLTVLYTPMHLAGARLHLTLHNETATRWEVCANDAACVWSPPGITRAHLPVAKSEPLTVRQGQRRLSVTCRVDTNCVATLTIATGGAECEADCHGGPPVR
jgi:hypothetical protein